MNSEPNYPKALRPGFSAITEWPVPDRFFEHPNVDSKVVRWDSITEENMAELPYIVTLLEELEEHFYIPTVHSQYIVTDEQKTPAVKHPNMSTDKILITIRDRVVDAIPIDVMLEHASNEPVGREFDDLSVKMLRHVESILDNGGIFMEEVYRYHQFVYSPSAPEGDRLILVDTEPLYPLVLPKKYQRMEGGTPVGIISSLAFISQDIVRLERVTGAISKAHIRLRSVLDKIDPEGFEEIEIAKQAIIIALEHGDEESLGFILNRGFRDEFFGSTAVDSTVNLAAYIKHRNKDRQLPYQPFEYQ